MNKPKILIIEDAPYISKMIAHGFDKESFEVIEVRSGKEGLKKITEWCPNIILADLLLPDMHDLEIVKEIVKLENGKKANVLIITNNDSQVLMQEAMELGVKDFFIKSNHSFFTITEMIQKFLDQNN